MQNETWEKEFDERFHRVGMDTNFGFTDGLDGYEQLKSFIRNLLTSRDTYWKERVEAVRRDLKARMAHEDYTKCVTCDETLYHLDSLISSKRMK